MPIFVRVMAVGPVELHSKTVTAMGMGTGMDNLIIFDRSSVMVW